MRVEAFNIYDRERQISEPFLRMSNAGCGLQGCNCSPEIFLSLSNGQVGLCATLSREEWELLKAKVGSSECHLTITTDKREKELKELSMEIGAVSDDDTFNYESNERISKRLGGKENERNKKF
jgi:hypothetical protein